MTSEPLPESETLIGTVVTWAAIRIEMTDAVREPLDPPAVPRKLSWSLAAIVSECTISTKTPVVEAGTETTKAPSAAFLRVLKVDDPFRVGQTIPRQYHHQPVGRSGSCDNRWITLIQNAARQKTSVSS